MRSKTLLLMIAGICGTIAAVGANSWMQAQGSAAVQPKLVEIFVTVNDIDLGEELTAENIKLEEWPVDRVPEGAMNKLKDLEGKFANQRLYAGEPLMKRKLMDSAGNTRRDIPEGYCVVSMQPDAASGVGNLVGPGDRVNVIGFFKESDLIPQTTTKVVLTSIRVYAVDGRTTRAEEEQVGKAAKTISLLIPNKEEEAWTYANELGSIRLSLSRPDESAKGKEGPHGETSGEQFLTWIGNYQKSPGPIEPAPRTSVPPTAATPPPAPATPQQAPLRMVKLGSEGAVHVYEQRNGMFVVVESNTEESPAAASPSTGTGSARGGSPYDYLNGSESPFFESEQTEPSEETGGKPAPSNEASAE